MVRLSIPFWQVRARTGLKELMDYCQLVRYRNESGNYNFVSSEDNVEVVGLLLTGRLRDDQLDAEQSEPLQGLKIKKDATGEWRKEPMFSTEIMI